MTMSTNQNHFSDIEFQSIHKFAKNRVMEPFEGQAGLEALQKAGIQLSKGTERIKSLGKSEKVKQIASISKKNFGKLLESLPKINELDLGTESFFDSTKDKMKGLESKIRAMVFKFVSKGMELTFNEDYVGWVLKNASKTLKRDFSGVDQLRELSLEDREILVKILYPYRSSKYKTLMSSFDKTFNIFLGAIVATNIPGTGILVSLINISKTMIRISNRLNSISALYGYKISNINALFNVSAEIIKSIENWEADESHRPLNPEIIADLYEEVPGDYRTSLQQLLETISVKEMYIAVPGIGMLSLSKINLDDYKLDLMIQCLVEDYFLKQQIIATDRLQPFENIVKDYQEIYEILKSEGVLHLIKNNIKKYRQESRGLSLWKNIKSLAGKDPDSDILDYYLGVEANSIYESIQAAKETEDALQVEDLVGELIESLKNKLKN